jgi:hypothetical protein
MAKKQKVTKQVAGSSQMKLSLKLDEAKIAQIQKCLKKGKLTITVANVATLARGGNGYLYD